MSEKTEQPTEKKLRDARKKGQVAQSQDVNRLLVTIFGFEVLLAFKHRLMDAIQGVILSPINQIHSPFEFAAMEVVKRSLTTALIISISLVVIVIFARFIAAWLQFGFLVAPESLKPDLKKFNPVTNLKNMFAPKKLVEFAGNILKAIVLAIVAFWVIRDNLPTILLLSTGTLDMSWQAGASLFGFMARSALLVFAAIAILDFNLQKFFFIKQQKMSKDEVKREYKESEGDPQLKGERKQLAHEFLMSDDMSKKVAQADVVTVNPTHFAIALSYKPGKTKLPVILCKGQDARAKEIIRIAKANNVPVVRYIWLARTLYAQGKEGRYIPRTTLRAMAAVFRAIKGIDDNVRKGQDNILEVYGEV